MSNQHLADRWGEYLERAVVNGDMENLVRATIHELEVRPFELDQCHPVWYSMAGVFEEIVDTARRQVWDGNVLTVEDYERMAALRDKMWRVMKIAHAVGAQAVHDEVHMDGFNRGLRVPPWPQMMLDLNNGETAEVGVSR